MSNPGMMLTDGGRMLLAKALIGKELKFSKVAFGAGDFDYALESLAELTQLKDWRMDLPLVGKEIEGNGCALILAQLSNYRVTEGFPAKEIGVFALDPDTNREVLYAYRNAGDEYTFIPAGGGIVQKNTTVAYRVEVQNAQNITCVVDFSFAYVSRETFLNHVENHPLLGSDVQITDAFWVTDNDLNLHRLPADSAREFLIGNDFSKLQHLQDFVQARAELGLDANIIVIEDFKPDTQIDTDKIKVVSCAKDFTTLTLASLQDLSLGQQLILTDKINSQQVTIQNIKITPTAYSIEITQPVNFDFNLDATYLEKTNFDVARGFASSAVLVDNLTLDFDEVFEGYMANLTRKVKFDVSRETFFESTVPLDATQETKIHGFEVGGTQPAGTDRRIIFKVDGEYYKLNGSVPELFNYEVNFQNVLDFGNTAANLADAEDIDAWCGKLIYPVIALDSGDELPTLELALIVSSFNDILSKSNYSAEFTLGDNAQFLDATFEKQLAGSARANLKVRLFDTDWSDFIDIDEAKGKACTKIQFRADYAVNSLNGDSAKIFDITCFYKTDVNKHIADTSILQFRELDFDDDLAVSALIVKHSKPADLRAFVNYNQSPVHKSVALGTGNGDQQIFYLTDSVKPDTFQVLIDGIQSKNFIFDAQNKSITITAPVGKEISADFFAGIVSNDWLEMEREFTEHSDNFDDDCFATRFGHTLSVGNNSNRVRLKIITTSIVEISKIAAEFSI